MWVLVPQLLQFILIKLSRGTASIYTVFKEIKREREQILFHAYLQILWSKTTSDGSNLLRPANDWQRGLGFAHEDFLWPAIEMVYSNLNQRSFKHPVMHKPPWNYVTLGMRKIEIQRLKVFAMMKKKSIHCYTEI